MRFANPEAFLLFIPFLAAAWYTWFRGVRLRSRFQYPMGSWIDQRPRFRLPSPFKVQFSTRFVALAFCIVALARPQEMFQKTNRLVDALDMVICLDLSKSMQAEDFKPNRLTVATNTLMDFVDHRPDDRIGLVLFSGEAYLAVPLTSDHDVVKDAIRNATTDGLQDGTAIGQALAVATSRLKDSKAKSRVIVLFTDGDNNMGSVDPLTAAELARGYGLKIYTIGLGKKGKVQFPIKTVDPMTGRTVVVYQWLTDAVNDELLDNIAKRTAGRFFKADEDGILERIFSTIDQLEKTRVETQTFTRYSELCWPWIFGALALLLLEGLALNTRWRKLP